MPTTITGDAGVSQVQDGAISLADLDAVLKSLQIKAKVVFNGNGTVGQNQTILSSYNVASVYKVNTGDFLITFTTALADANYATHVTASNDQTSCPVAGTDNTSTPTTTQIRITVVNDVGSRCNANRISVTAL